MLRNNKLINEDKYSEIQHLDELLRALQDETLNADWGYWHFALLNLKDGENLAGRIHASLTEIARYKDPYVVDPSVSRHYIAGWDLANLTLEPVTDLKNEIILHAEHWCNYQGPITGNRITERFHSLKYEVLQFLQSKEIIEIKLVCGIDTFYSFGGDHGGEDILVDTKAGVYLIHFGFSS